MMRADAAPPPTRRVPRDKSSPRFRVDVRGRSLTNDVGLRSSGVTEKKLKQNDVGNTPLRPARKTGIRKTMGFLRIPPSIVRGLTEFPFLGETHK
jgi:hypothetical protein